VRHLFQLLAVVLLATPAAAADLSETTCIVMAEKPDGKVDTVLKDIHVLEPDRTSTELVLMLPQGYSHGSVLCGRSDIVPADTDWKVLAAGYTLGISSGSGSDSTLAILEIVDGRLRVRFVDGKANPDQALRIQSRLNQMQTAINAAYESKHPAP
jgi:hypothetical protein